MEMCYQKFKPKALLSGNSGSHRSGKWVTQIWQKDRMFANLSRDSLLLNLPTIPVFDFLDPNQVRRYVEGSGFQERQEMLINYYQLLVCVHAVMGWLEYYLPLRG